MKEENPVNFPPAGELLVRIGYNPNDIWRDDVEFRLGVNSEEGIHLASPLEFGQPREIGTCSPPAFRVCVKTPEGQRFMQSLIDQLWAMGCRPTEIGTPGHQAYLNSHLQDMRAIAGHALGVELPKTDHAR